MKIRDLTSYERKKLLDIKLDNGTARGWNSGAETFDEYLEAMDIPKTTDVLISPYTNKFTDPETFIGYYRECPCDFVYDAKSGIFYTDFILPHVDFLARLYRENGGEVRGTTFDAADAFVYSGMGLFKSRAGNRILASEKLVLPEALWFIRRDLEYMA